MQHIQASVPAGRCWLLEPFISGDGELSLHLWPVNTSGSLSSYPIITVSLLPGVVGGDE